MSSVGGAQGARLWWYFLRNCQLVYKNMVLFVCFLNAPGVGFFFPRWYFQNPNKSPAVLVLGQSSRGCITIEVCEQRGPNKIKFSIYWCLSFEYFGPRIHLVVLVKPAQNSKLCRKYKCKILFGSQTPLQRFYSNASSSQPTYV